MPAARCLLLAILLSTIALPPCADDEHDVRMADTRYWQAFNTCDLKAMEDLFTDDVEFYHDKTGLTVSKAAVIESLRTGPCNSPALHLRREAVQASVRFHPLAGGFALLSGTHRFHVSEAGKPERLDGQAEFTNLWQSVAGHCRMRRVFSYAHAPVVCLPPATHLTLSNDELRAFAGRYRGDKVGDISVVAIGDGLRLTAGSLIVTLRAETPHLFFALERDLHFDFDVSSDGREKASLLTVREHGEIVETAGRIY